MRTWISEGRVSADSLVWREGWRDWQEAKEVLPQLSGNRPAEIGILSPQVAGATTPVLPAAIPAKSSKAMQLTVIGLLVLAVIVLSAVFVWIVVLQSDESAEPAAAPSPAAAVALPPILPQTLPCKYAFN